MNDKTLELWGTGTSRTHRTLWMAHEMGLDFVHRPAQPRNGDTKTPEFLALSPRHKVPIMRHGDVVLTESAAIMTYMTESFAVPGHIFVADDPLSRARHAEWCFFIMSELDANALYSMRRHGALKEIYGDSPVAVDAGRGYFLYQVERMAGALQAADPFLMGQKLSPADILMASCLDWAVRYEITLPGYLQDYLAMMAARPAFQQANLQNEA